MAKSMHATITGEETAPGASLAGSRQALSRYLHGGAVLLRHAETLTQLQLEMLQRTALLHRQMAGRLERVTTPSELLGVQSQLMLTAMGEWAQYGQQMGLATLRLRAEAAAQPARPAPAPAAPPGAETATEANPVIDAWQSLFKGFYSFSSAAAR